MRIQKYYIKSNKYKHRCNDYNASEPLKVIRKRKHSVGFKQRISRLKGHGQRSYRADLDTSFHVLKIVHDGFFF